MVGTLDSPDPKARTIYFWLGVGTVERRKDFRLSFRPKGGTRMSKEQWFQNFERIQAEHPELSDEEASEMASEKQREDFADRADQLKDEAKYDGPHR